MAGGAKTFGNQSRVQFLTPVDPPLGSQVRLIGAPFSGALNPSYQAMVGELNSSPIAQVQNANQGVLAAYSFPFGVGYLNPTTEFDGVYAVPLAAASAAGLANAAGAMGLLVGSRPQLYNGATWDLARGGADNADDVAAIAAGLQLMLARNTLFDGTTWDRARAASAAALSGFTTAGAQLVSDPGNWSINHVPAAATQATISRAAGGAGVRHVCTSIGAVLIIPPAVNQPAIQLNLRDGATGAGTILWSQQFGIGAALAAGGQQQVNLSGLKIVGSANTAMTLEFTAAGAATTLQSVALTGHEAA
jgi:hypothetical protein